MKFFSFEVFESNESGTKENSIKTKERKIAPIGVLFGKHQQRFSKKEAKFSEVVALKTLDRGSSTKNLY